mgnify:FL=1
MMHYWKLFNMCLKNTYSLVSCSGLSLFMVKSMYAIQMSMLNPTATAASSYTYEIHNSIPTNETLMSM